MKKPLLVLFLSVALLFGCATGDDDDSDVNAPDDDTTDDDDDDYSPFMAGFARVDISPDHPVMMGGYDTAFFSTDNARWSTGVHDPIYATAVAFTDAKSDPVVLIHLDVVGVILPDVVKIREGVSSALAIPVEGIIVASSHSHGGPDTIGIYGVWIPPICGRDDLFIQRMIDGAVEAGIAARQNLVPATLKVATGVEEAMHENTQEPVDRTATIDDNMNLLAAYDLDGRLLGTLMSWGCHPMVMGRTNTEITSDYPGPYYRFMDAEAGGVNMYVNTSLGAAVHPTNPYEPYDEREGGDWDDLDNFGRVLADDAQNLLAVAQPLSDYTIHLHSRTVRAQLENPLFALVGQLGLIPREFPPLGEYGESIVTAFSIGEVRFGTVPGELVPNIGLELREIMGGEHQFLITLGMDWLGYILTAEQYKKIVYIYFSILSVGPEMGDMCIQEYHSIFDNWPNQ